MTDAPPAVADDQAWDAELATKLLRATHLTPWDLLCRSAHTWPDRPAVVHGTAAVTFADLVRRATACASALRAHDVGRGTVVAYLMAPTIEWAVLHYALTCLGAVALPVNLAYSAREVETVLQLAAPEIVVTMAAIDGVDVVDRLRSIAPDLDALAPSVRRTFVLDVDDGGHVDATGTHACAVFGRAAATTPLAGAARPDDPCSLVFTSGSTAAPKGALLAHRGISGAATAYAHALRLDPDDRFLMLYPTFHVTGPVYIAAAHSVGAALHVFGAFDSGRALDALERGRCTTTFCLPTHLVKLMGDPTFPARDVSSFRRIGLGGSRSFWEQLHRVFELESITTVYGSTESSSVLSLTTPARLPTSHGRPLPGMDCKIVDPDTGAEQPPNVAGEICFRGWGTFLEYLGGDTGDFDADGYFHTGDIGDLDEHGQLHYRGRYKMMIKTGGENVAELEVETFLENEIPAIEVAQVVGAPDPVWGESIVAFVQLRADAAAADTDALRTACRDLIAGFKIPKRFEVVAASDWPVLANGKIDKNELRRRAAALGAVPS